MNMRLPTSITLNRTESGKYRALRNLLPHNKISDAGRVEMPIEGEERIPLIGFMRQNDHTAIIQPSGPIDRSHHNAIQWRMDGTVCRQKHIHAKMQCPPPIDRVIRCQKGRFSINQTRLQIMPYMGDVRPNRFRH